MLIRGAFFLGGDGSIVGRSVLVLIFLLLFFVGPSVYDNLVVVFV